MSALPSLLEQLGRFSREPDSERRRWGGVFTSLGLVTVIAASALAVGYALLGAKGDAIVAVVVALGAVATLAVFRFTQNIELSQRFVLTLYIFVFSGAALGLGEISYLAWLGVLMLMAFFVGGPIKGLGWVFLMAAMLISTGTMMWLFPVEPEHVSGAVRLLRVCSLPPVLAAYGYFYELARSWNAAELEAARLAAQKANDAKSRLLAKVSHEIRTPLNGVLGLTRSLLSRPLPGAVAQELELVEKSGAGLLALISDLLDIGRAEAGQVELHATPVELGQLLVELCALHRSSARQKGLELRIDMGPTEPVWVLVDEVRLRQVLGNLLSNAIKFTNAGAVVVRLRLGHEEASWIDTSLSVEDSGAGLDTASLAQVFEPFKQFHPHLEQGGSGLGLAISQELAKAMGGRLVAESTLGEGSTFTLHLPLQRTAPLHTNENAPVALESFTALIVDDNAINRRVARAFVSLLGGVAVEARDGFEALRLLTERTFDVILMDLQMPGMDGLEATAALQTQGVTTPVLAVTAAAGPETHGLCTDAGMKGVLVKPLQLDLLREELSRVLSASSRAA